jgi:ATP-dependent Clp protease ATP-binding subunit ClpA
LPHVRCVTSASCTPSSVRRSARQAANTRKTGQIPFTKHARRVLENALRTAVRWEHEALRTEHLLVGLLADPSSRAVRRLADAGLQPATIAERLFTNMQFADPAGEASGYAPAAAESDEVSPWRH